MSAFGGLILTNKGRALQTKAQTGIQLNFTRLAAGDGDLGGTSILDLNALKHEVMSLGIARLKTMSGGKALVGTVLSNQDVVSGFYFREIGVFALDPDEGEILYCYGNAGANAEYIPAGGGADVIEKNIDIITIVGNAASVNATIDDSLVFVTVNEFNEHLAELRQTFNAPRVNLIDGDSLVIFRGIIPADKSLKILSAGICKSDGTTQTGLSIELFNNTADQSLLMTEGSFVQGDPLYDGPNTSGADVEIRLNNATGATVNCQGFMQVVVD